MGLKSIGRRLAKMEGPEAASPCDACKDRPTLSNNPADALPCKVCGRRPKVTVVCHAVVSTKQAYEAARAEAEKAGREIIGPDLGYRVR